MHNQTDFATLVPTLPAEIQSAIYHWFLWSLLHSPYELSQFRSVNQETKDIIDCTLFKELFKIDFKERFDLFRILSQSFDALETKAGQDPGDKSDQTPEATPAPNYYSLYKQAFFQEEMQQVKCFTTDSLYKDAFFQANTTFSPISPISFFTPPTDFDALSKEFHTLSKDYVTKRPPNRNWLLACRDDLRQPQLIKEAKSRLEDIRTTPGNEINLGSLNEHSLSVEAKSILIELLYITAIYVKNEDLFLQLLAQYPLNDINMTIYNYYEPLSQTKYPFIRRYPGKTLLGHVCYVGCLRMAKMLTDHYFDKLDISAYSDDGDTALHECVVGDLQKSSERTEVAKLLLSLGADPDAPSLNGDPGKTKTPYEAASERKDRGKRTYLVTGNTQCYFGDSVREVITQAHNEKNGNNNSCGHNNSYCCIL